MDSGPTDWKKLNTFGRTKVLQNIKPRKNKIVPNIVLVNIIPFSFLYNPGAIKTNIWYKKNGIEIKRAKNAVNLNGTINGDATSIAISSISEILLNADTRKSNKKLLNGNIQIKAMMKKINE